MKKAIYIAIFLIAGLGIYIYTGIFIRSYGFREAIKEIITSGQSMNLEELREEIVLEGGRRGLILTREGVSLSILGDNVMVEVEYFVPGGFSGFKVNQHFYYRDSLKIPGKAITDSIKRSLERSLERSFKRSQEP